MAEGHDAKQAREEFEAAERDNAKIPGAESGGHNRSHAAHLAENGHVHTTPEGYGKQGREPGTLNEPPQDPDRNGRQSHRG